MSGQKKCIRLQIDFPIPIEDDYQFEKISIQEISNMRLKLSIKNLKEQKLNSYEICSISSSSVSGYSSASDSLMSSVLSNDQIKYSRNVYDKLSYRKVSGPSMNYDCFKNRVENVYEEIIHEDNSSIEYKPCEFIKNCNDKPNTTELPKFKIGAKNLNKVYSINQIIDNIEKLTECAIKQEEMAQIRNSFSSCSESIYV